MTIKYPSFDQVEKAYSYMNNLDIPGDAQVLVIDEDNDPLRSFIAVSTGELRTKLQDEIDHHLGVLSNSLDGIIDMHLYDIDEYINKNIQDLVKEAK